jgi:hypothetical protein
MTASAFAKQSLKQVYNLAPSKNGYSIELQAMENLGKALEWINPGKIPSGQTGIQVLLREGMEKGYKEMIDDNFQTLAIQRELISPGESLHDVMNANFIKAKQSINEGNPLIRLMAESEARDIPELLASKSWD